MDKSKNRTALKRQGTLSLGALPQAATLEVRLTTGKSGDEFKSLRLRSDLDVDELRSKVDALYGSREAKVESLDGALIESHDELKSAFHAYQESESARRRDVLEAKLEEIRSALASPARDVAAHARACHALWEIACDPTNHKYLTYSLFDHITASIRSRELRCRNLAAAALWVLADQPATAVRLPVTDLVPALIEAVFADPRRRTRRAAADDEEEGAAEGGSEGSENEDEGEEAGGAEDGDDEAGGGGGADGGGVDELMATMMQPAGRGGGGGMGLPRIPNTLAALGALANDNDNQGTHAMARAGYALLEQRLWLAGALLACLTVEAGRKAFQRAEVALRLLPMLEAPPHQSPPPFKAACAALLAQAAAVSPPVCKSLLSGGALSLVHLIVDGDLTSRRRRSGADWRTQLQAADLLKFALARVRLSPAVPAERELLESLPAMMGELRAAACPLAEALLGTGAASSDGAAGGGGGESTSPGEGRQGAAASSKEEDDKLAKLLRGVVGCMWGMGAALRLAGYVLPAPRGLVALCAALLEVAPERPTPRGDRATRISKTYGAKLRSFALGILASLEFPPTGQPLSAAAEALRHSEQLAFEAACARNGISVGGNQAPSEPEGEPSAAAAGSNKGRRVSRGAAELRQVSVVAAAAAATAMQAAEAEEMHGPFRGASLQRLRALAVQLLGHLDDGVAPGHPVTRATESYAAALAAIAPVSSRALMGEGAIDQLLAICTRLSAEAAGIVETALAAAEGALTDAIAAVENAKSYNDKITAEEALEAATAALEVAKEARPALTGPALRVHGQCLATILAISSHGHPALSRGATSFDDVLAPGLTPEEAATEKLKPFQRKPPPVDAAGAPVPALDASTATTAAAAAAPGAPPMSKKQKRAAAAAAQNVPPPISEEAIAAATAVATDAAHRAVRRPHVLSPEHVQGVITHVRMSTVAGATDGAAVLWLQACYPGGDELIGDLGGAEVLAAMLHEASFEHGLKGGYAAQAAWVTAAIWRLCSHAPNARTALLRAPGALLACLQQAEHRALRTAALGCVSVMLTRSDLISELRGLGASQALHSLARSGMGSSVDNRATATRTLSTAAEAERGTKHGGAKDGGGAAAEARNGEAADAAPVSLDASLDASSSAVDGPAAEEAHEGDEGEAAGAANGGSAPGAKEDDGADNVSLDELMVRLLSDSSRRLRAIGCRGVARSAQQSLSACRVLVALDAPKRLVAVLRPEVDRLFMRLGMPPYHKPAAHPTPVAVEADGAADGTADTAAEGVAEAPTEGEAMPPEAGEISASGSPASRGVAAADVGAGDDEEEEDGMGGYELLHDSLNATLNLSGAKVAQVPLARLALWTLLELWHASQAQAHEWTGTLALIGTMAGETLTNLACNGVNRTLMYRAELQLKVASWSGAPLRKASLSPRALEPGGRGSAAEGAEALGGDGSGDPASAADEEGAADPRKRFTDWLGGMEAAEAAEEARKQLDASSLEGEEDGSGPSKNVLLARAAFTLMDQNGDGELSRFEMVRSFRLDERVRELLLPLLPMPAVSKQSITGVDLQQQIDAFEELFKAMDSDGNDGIDKHEFETFFKRTETKKKRSKGDAAAARRRLLAPLRSDEGATLRRSMSGTSLAPGPTPTVASASGSPAATTTTPKLGRLLRLNAIDTWRKPLVSQLPPARNGPPMPHAGRRVQTPSGHGEGLGLSRPGTMASVPSRSRLTTAGTGSGGLSPLGASRRGLPLSQSLPSLGPGPSSLARSQTASTSRPKTTATEQRAPRPSLGTSAVPPPTATQAGGGTEAAAGAPLPSIMPAPAPAVPPLALPAADDPWRPHVTGIEVLGGGGASGPGGEMDSLDPVQRLALGVGAEELSAVERAYLQRVAGDRLNLKISLPEDEQYTPRFHFRPTASEKGAKSGPSGKLVSWQATAGSRVGDSVAPSFTLPNGKEMRFFHKENRRNARKPTAEPSEASPDSLRALGLTWLPARPSPPRPNESDVPKLEHAIEMVAPKP